MSDYLEQDARGVNGWMVELGLTGKPVEVALDGERHLESLVRSMMTLPNCSVSRLVLQKTHKWPCQGNG